jgi:hypothetical protein
LARKIIPRFNDIGTMDIDPAAPAPLSLPIPTDEDVASAGQALHPAAFAKQSWVGPEPERAEQTAVIRRVWGDSILAEPSKVSAIVRTQSVMAEETGHILKSSLNIGRSLLELKAVLSREEFARGLRRSAEAFRGWSSGNVSKVMRVAEFVDQAKMTMAVLPQSYTTLYEFTTLDDIQLEKAKALSLLRPDVRRSDIVEFKRKVVGANAGTQPPSQQLVKIEERIRTLRAELAQAIRERNGLLAMQKK